MPRQAGVINVICGNCGKIYQPFGDEPVVPPTYSRLTCPYCGHKENVVFDDELRREIARRELNLDNQLGMKELESSYKTLKGQVESLSKRIEGMDKDIATVKEAINSLIPAVRKQVAEAIANLLQPAKENNPLSH